MPTRRDHGHLGSGKFKIEVEGVTQGAFTALSGLEASAEVVAYVDDGDMLVRKSGSFIVPDETIKEILRYNFREAWPCRRKGFALDASTADTLVECFGITGSCGGPCRASARQVALKGDLHARCGRQDKFQKERSTTQVEELEIVVEKIERA